MYGPLRAAVLGIQPPTVEQTTDKQQGVDPGAHAAAEFGIARSPSTATKTRGMQQQSLRPVAAPIRRRLLTKEWCFRIPSLKRLRRCAVRWH